MTAEIAIMNKDAIALATDSAVTLSGSEGKKIFTSANKLFSLSKYHPVGIMVYGNAIFMGIPWETIIKIYRNRLGKRTSISLKDYAEDFIQFLNDGNLLFPEISQKDHFQSTVYSYFEHIKGRIKEEVQSQLNEKGSVTDEDVNRIISIIIKKHYDSWDKTPNIPSIPTSFNKKILSKYNEMLDNLIKDVFEKLPIGENEINELKVIAVDIFSKFPDNIANPSISGVVIAGFGEGDTFPSLRSFILEGIVDNKLKFKPEGAAQIDYVNDSVILAFAQKEMVSRFMEGVDPQYKEVEEKYLSKIFHSYAKEIVGHINHNSPEEKKKLEDDLTKVGDEIFKEHIKQLDIFRQEKFINPVAAVVSMLPKDELAAMAESLVNLTSFKRKISMDMETVAGPIDVAVISKGDGFIWIKRKHYFKPELNQQFFKNYFGEGSYE